MFAKIGFHRKDTEIAEGEIKEEIFASFASLRFVFSGSLKKCKDSVFAFSVFFAVKSVLSVNQPLPSIFPLPGTSRIL